MKGFTHSNSKKLILQVHLYTASRQSTGRGCCHILSACKICSGRVPKVSRIFLTRQRNEYPFIEVFYNPEQAASPGKGVDPSVTKYFVKVLPFNYDQSVYGFREYFKKHGFSYTETM